jgi:preprotein translocase subunit SecE
VAQQDNAPNKPVHLIYLVGTVVLFYLLQWTIDWIWGYFTVAPSDFQISLIAAVVATVAGIWMYRDDRLYTLTNEVATELKKVTWPTAKEVRAATIVVIVMAIISAVVLFLFDIMWSSLTDVIYGG